MKRIRRLTLPRADFASGPPITRVMAPTVMTLVAFAILASPTPIALGQTLVAPPLRKPKPAIATQVTNVRIRASAESDPALRYRFWPAPEHRTKDSPTPFVNRAILMGLQAMDDPAKRTEFSEGFDKWSEMPIEQLPSEEIRKFVEKFGGNAIRELRRAENQMKLDYDLQLSKLSAAELIQTLLPEFQEMRHLARLLSLRIRVGIADRQWQQVTDDIRLGFRMAEVAGHSTDFLVGRLVGFAISGMMMNATMEAIQQPGCPNLYWALASLPQNRLFETRDSIEYESVLVSRMMKSRPLPDSPIGAAKARLLIKELAEQVTVALAYGGEDDSNHVSAHMMSGVYVVTMADEAREFLAESTPWGERALELSAPEAVLRATYFRFERARDSWLKWALLPPETWPEYEAEQNAIDKANMRTKDIMASLLTSLQPAVGAARRAGRRTLQQRNLLISIEALRMHAAEKGELPETIDRLRPLPFWMDGISLTPFGYNRDSPTTATLTRGKRWPGDPNTVFKIELVKGNQ